VAFEGEQVLDQLETLVERSSDPSALRALLLSGPLISDAPDKVADLCQRAGMHTPVLTWDVLELAGLLMPNCPTESLDHVGAFLGAEPPDDDG
jgi:hypothetical protein